MSPGRSTPGRPGPPAGAGPPGRAPSRTGRGLAEPVRARLRRQGRAADEGLDGVAALAAEHLELGLVLDALGDEAQAQALGQRHHRTGEERPVLVLGRALEEGAGEL